MVRRNRTGLKQTSVHQDGRTANDRGGKSVVSWRLRRQHRTATRDGQQVHRGRWCRTPPRCRDRPECGHLLGVSGCAGLNTEFMTCSNALSVECPRRYADCSRAKFVVKPFNRWHRGREHTVSANVSVHLVLLALKTSVIVTKCALTECG